MSVESDAIVDAIRRAIREERSRTVTNPDGSVTMIVVISKKSGIEWESSEAVRRWLRAEEAVHLWLQAEADAAP